MFRATIRHGLGEPFHISGNVAPYDLQVLREHVLARRSRDTRVEVELAPIHRPAFLRALRDLSARGVVMVMAP